MSSVRLDIYSSILFPSEGCQRLCAGLVRMQYNSAGGLVAFGRMDLLSVMVRRRRFCSCQRCPEKGGVMDLARN